MLSAGVLPLPNGGEADTDLTVPVLEGLAFQAGESDQRGHGELLKEIKVTVESFLKAPEEVPPAARL